MRVELGAREPAQLTYCTNIHPGEGWADVARALSGHVAEVKRLASPRAPMGVGLRLSARASAELEAPEPRARLRELLERGELYVFTLNGFPYGDFHGRRVKERVYAPDWGSAERLAYTERLAGLLAEVLPPGLEGSISTVPGGFRPDAAGVARIAENLRSLALKLAGIERDTGKRVALALEPEPGCLLETVEQAVRFFEEHLLSRQALADLAQRSGESEGKCEAFVRRHLGVCLDACHLAVAFEEPENALEALRRAGIAIPKVQLSAGLEATIEGPGDEASAHLARFAEDVYLHQVCERRGGALRRFLDLPEALADRASSSPGERTWRVHFHVPIVREALGRVRTTQPELRALIEQLRAAPGARPHLEVETYSFGVLPRKPGEAPGDPTTSIAAELRWARQALGEAP